MENRAKRTAYVIMPFVETPSRNADDLTAFFYDALKKPIEASNVLKEQWVVNRSDGAIVNSCGREK